MLPTPSVIQISRALPLATGATTAHFVFTSKASAKIRNTALVLTGTTINSAADVVVTIEKLPVGGGGAVAVNTINMPTATASGGQVQGSAIATPVSLVSGDVVRATVSTAATVAGGDGYVSLGITYE